MQPPWPLRHRLDQIERLAAADLADDDAIGPQAQRGAEEIADGDLAAAARIRRPRLELHDVRRAGAAARASPR